jgi:hypothetical protein
MMRRLTVGVTAIAFALSLLAIRCTETTIVPAGDALSDPRFAPRIMLSSPPLNSVGPYAFWGDAPFGGRLIFLRFNKLMVRRSLHDGLVLRSSQRAIRTLLPDSEYPRDVTEEFTLAPEDSLGRYPFSVGIGEVLSLVATRPLVDVNGYTIDPGLLGTFVPEPVFRVRGLLPSPGNEAKPGELIRLTFNSKIDSSILPFVTVAPSAPLRWYLDPSDPFSLNASVIGIRGGEYAILVGVPAHDQAGHALAKAYVGSFRVEGLRLLSTILSPENPVVDRSILCTFSRNLLTETAVPSVSIVPPVAGGLSISPSGPYLYINARTSFAPGTSYAITIDTSLRATDGNSLPAPITIRFQTAAFTATGSYPVPGSTGVSIIWDLAVYFTARLDPATVAGAFSISPPVDGLAYTPSQQPSQLRFALTDTLRSHTTYTVRIDTSLRSRAGYPMQEPIEFSFTTGGS